MAPLVAWLAAIGLSLWLGRGRVLPPLVLRVFVVACGGVAALLTALLPMGGATLIAGAGLSPSTLLLVVGVAAVWGLLLVLASRVVKGLRTRLASSTVAGAGRPSFALSSPAGPSLGAAALVGGVMSFAGDGAFVAPGTVGGLLLAAAVVLALLAAGGAPVRGCHSGLFDCALPIPTFHSLSSPGMVLALEGSLGAAPLLRLLGRLTMLPMMASLALMLELCAGGGLTQPALLITAHLACMLIPAALLDGTWLGRWLTPALRVATAGLALILGGALLLAGPNLVGWMLASLAHGAAWGLVWSAGLDGPRLQPSRVPVGPAGGEESPPSGPRWRHGWISLLLALLPAGVVLTLGVGVETWGPVTFMLTHGALALAATAAMAAAGCALLAIRGGPARADRT